MPPSTVRSGNKRCPACAKAWRATATCVTCDADLSRRRSAKYCSQRCCDIDRGQIRAEPLPVKACALPACGLEFVPTKAVQRCCSESHGKKLWHVEHPGQGYEWNDTRRDNYHRRRARKKATSTGRPVRLAEIRERDGSRCHLCERKVPDKAWPHPLSASLDHVIPLSKGGIHDPSNVKLAHLRCNVEKGNGGGNEQLLLIG